MPENLNTNSNVGTKIKEIRNEKKITLKQLSEKTNLSVGFLSQLERGLSNIAIDSLQKIATAFNVSIQDLLDTRLLEDESPHPVVRNYERKVTIIHPTLHSYSLTHCVHQLPFLPREYHVLPNYEEDLDIQEYSHEGFEWIYIIEGILSLTIDNQKFDLYPGDSITIDSSHPHNWQNRGSKIVKFIAINTPNPFQK